MQYVGPRNYYRVLSTACGAILLALLGGSFLYSRGMPIYQVVSFTLFGACLAVLLGFAAGLGLEDSRRYGKNHSH